MINGGPWRKYSLVSLDFVCAYSMHGLFSLCALASDVVALQQVHVQVHLHARRHVYRKEYAVTLRCGTPILRTSSGTHWHHFTLNFPTRCRLIRVKLTQLGR